MNAPPRIPPSPPVIPASAAPPVDFSSVIGAQGMSPAELQTAVAQGGRFVVFQYCVSLLVVSLKRSSPLYFIKPGESAFTRSLPYTLISFVAGWWGIPWGPIWTLMTMATNVSGGKDLTRAILPALGASPQAAAAAPPSMPDVSPVEAAEREARKSSIRRLAWTAVVILFLLIIWVGYKLYQAEH